MTELSPLHHALAYAALGWRVVPIKPGEKYPAVDAWQEAATTDPHLIAQWWTEWPGHGVGIATGPRSGLWALDVDPAHGGDETLQDLERANGQLPDTVEAITGGGGRHLLFAWPHLNDTEQLTNSAGRLGPGLDTRGTGGQIVVAPTLHPTTGHAYAWELEHLPGQTPVAQAPDWLLELAVTRTEPQPEGQVDDGHCLDYARDRYDFDEGWHQRAVELLQSCGWHSPRTDRRGVTYLTRPGKTTYEGQGASIGKIPGVTYIWTDGAPPLQPGGYRNHQLLEALKYQGDPLATDQALVELVGGWRTVFSDTEGRQAVAEVRAKAQGDARLLPGPYSHYLDGQRFIFGLGDDDAPAVWGHGEQVLWAEGEALLIVGPPGVGKTTIAGQLLAGRLGILDQLLEWPIAKGRRKTLYLASDRPRQIARSLRRTFRQGDDEGALRDGLVVWQGPPPEDIALNTDLLLQMCQEVDADTLFLDSLKDMAVGLNNDEVAAGLNRAIQKVLRAGVEVLILHHQRKAQNGAKPTTLADVYGSTWITAGVGSVILIWGDAGDAAVELRHLKQPADLVGPLRIEHDHQTGRTTMSTDSFSLLSYVSGARQAGRTTTDCARAMHGLSATSQPTRAQVRRAGDALKRLERDAKVRQVDGPSKGGSGGGGEGSRWVIQGPLEGVENAPWK